MKTASPKRATETQLDETGQARAAALGSGWVETGKAALWALVICLPFFGVGGSMVYSHWRMQRDAREAAIAATMAHERLVSGAAGPAVPLEDATAGRDVFMNACAACHGADGTGVTGLGRNLTVSDFVALQSDEGLHEFIVKGRPQAKPPMPPRAGRDDLTDEDLRRVVAYLRGLQDPRRMPELPAYVVDTTPSEEQKSSALAAAGGDEELAGYIASGDRLFHTTCIACHGRAGVGIAGNGKALAKNEFIGSLDDDGLLAFITRGRGPTDPGNTTGIQMPPKGGNPALSEDDILDIIAYLRTLQGDRSGALSSK